MMNGDNESQKNTGSYSPRSTIKGRLQTRRLSAARKTRGLTCANCRAKKVRCDGGQPGCKTCEIYAVDCRYDKTPPMSQVLNLTRQLQEAEKVIAELRQNQNEIGRPSSSKSRSSPAVPNQNQAASPQRLSFTSPLEQPIGHSPSLHSTALPAAQHAPRVTTTPRETPLDLILDDQGKINYYGPTSAVHEPAEQESPVSCVSNNDSATKQSGSWSSVLASDPASDAIESSLWEEYALENAALRAGIPRHVLAKLLHLHWIWVSPMFMWVYRPAFLRDMTTGGRYYSELLLTVLCAHAAKYLDDTWSRLLNSRLRLLLSDAIHEPSSIPTVQALLQLSARELANGALSQAWLYSGMAFRMADDLVLQHDVLDVSHVKGVSPMDLEVRRRLSWSCYFWDKAMSLYTGRLPVVTVVPPTFTLNSLDDSAEQEIWSPYYGNSLSLTNIAPYQFPYMKSHVVSAFSNSCKLSIIISDVIQRLYSRQNKPIVEAGLIDIQTRLDDWRAQSPPYLKYDPANLPSTSPPPHIVSQNILYFTTVILAYRPFWSITEYYQNCISAARSIEKLLVLFESAFGFENISYLMGYCIYTGASVMLEHTKKGQDGANNTMRTFLRALQAGSRRCPLLERSLNIVIRSLQPSGIQRPPIVTGSNPATTATTHTRAHTPYYLPAFPQLEHQDVNANLDGFEGGGGGFGDQQGFTGSSSMLFLDCYPEMQLNLGDFAPSQVQM